MSIKNIVIAQTPKISAYDPTTGQVEGIDTTTGNITANTGYYFLGDGGLLSNISGGGGTPNAIANGTGTLSIALDSGNLSITNPGGSGDANLNFNNDSVAIGYNVGTTNQGANAIAIGVNAGTLNQPANSIMLNASPIELNGTEEGFYVNPMRGDIGNVATAVYYNSSTYELTFAPTVSATIDWANVANKSGASGPDTVAIGNSAALIGTQGANAVAIGVGAGRSNQDGDGVAIGTSAGLLNQSNSAIAIGRTAGLSGQGEQAVAIGTNAGGTFQGANAVAIGPLAGQTSQPANSIMINAGETALNGTEEGFYVQPVRNDTGNVTNVVYYNTSTNEVTYGPIVISYDDSNVANYLPTYTGNLGNVNDIGAAGNIDALGNLTISGNAAAAYFIGDGSQLTGLPAEYTDANVANYLPTYTGNLASLTGNVTTTANVTAARLIAGNANITSNVTAAALSLGTGNLQLTGNLISSTADTITIDPLGDGTSAGNLIVQGNMQVAGTLTYNNIVNATTNDLQWIAANNAINEAAASGGGISVGPTGSYAQFTYDSTSNSWQSSLPLTANGNVTGNTLVATTGRLTLTGLTGRITVDGSDAMVVTEGAAGAKTALGLAATSAANGVSIGTVTNLFNDAGTGAVLIGWAAGQKGAGAKTVAIGYQAGTGPTVGSGLGANSIAIGAGAAANGSAANSIILNATGANFTPSTTQANSFYVNPVREDTSNITNAMYYDTTTKEVTYGPIGEAQSIANGSSNVTFAGSGGNITFAVNGINSGKVSTDSVALGYATGSSSQGANGVAVGGYAGQNQGANAVAVGYLAGQSTQGANAVAVGGEAGRVSQGARAVSIGFDAGTSGQGANAVAIGAFAGATNQSANSIIINATGAALNGSNQGLYAAPVRNDNANVTNAVYYNTATKELTYGANAPVVKVSGTWTVTTGTNNYSFTVPVSNTYMMWVRGTVTNGILTWNATATVTNNNVPVVGAQYGWNYTGGGTPIQLTSIPDQFVGTANVISSTNPSVTIPSNTFIFGIRNDTGANVTVDWGYTQIS